MVANEIRLNDVFNLNNDTMTTEERELKSAEWRSKDLFKNSVLADVRLSVCSVCGKKFGEVKKCYNVKCTNPFQTEA